MRVAGVDGCKGGWVVACLDGGANLHVARASTFAEVLQRTDDCAAVGLDMPIGLPATQPQGGRRCEVEARALLGARRSSIFSTPARSVLSATDYDQAAELNREHSVGNRGISKQTWALVPKIREVDHAMSPALQQRVVEIHPELSFRALNDGQPLEHRKAAAAGAFARIRLLTERLGIGLADLEAGAQAAGKGVGLDDILDAIAGAWTAQRFATHEATCLPGDPPLDARGLRMELWF